MNDTRLPKKAQEFFLSKSWEDYFVSSRLRRGTNLFKSEDASLDNLIVDVDQSTFAFFTVTGSYAYEVEVSYSNNGRFFSFCDCPDDPKCKHIVAAILTLERHIVENQPESEKLAQDAVAPAQSVESWLEDLTQSISDPEAENDDSDSFPSNYKDRVIYMLGQEYDYDPVALHAYKGRIQKDGSFKITAHSVRTDYMEYNRPKYVTPADMSLLSQIASASNKYNASSSVTSNSPSFFDLVVDCLKTGRVIAKGSESVHDRNASYQPLELGDVRTMSPSWTPTDDNALKPTILIDPKPDQVVDCSPKLYIDRRLGFVGKLEQTHSDTFIEQWQRGPTIQPDELAKVKNLIEQNPELRSNDKPSKTKLSTAIPQLPKYSTQQGIKPTASLTIERVDATAENALLISSPVKSVLVGCVHFRYDEQSVLAEPFTETFTVTKGHEVITIHRDASLEAEMLTQLSGYKTLPLKDAFDANIIQKEHQSSFLFSTNEALNKQQWIGFISAEVPILEAKGWNIEIGDLDYTLIEYDTVFEDLSKLENNSEWFRFDLGVEHNGEKISLIPALAAAISSGMYEGYDFDSAGGGLIAIPLDGKNTFINFPAKRFQLILSKVQDIFQHVLDDGSIHIPQLRAATLIDDLNLDKCDATMRDLAALGAKLKDVKGIPKTRVPKNLQADLRPYQIEGFRWLQFLAKHKLHGVLADDMGLGKTIQTLTHILAEKNSKRSKGKPTLIVAPTSVIPNWRAEAAKFTPSLSLLLLHGSDRKLQFKEIKHHDIVVTSYALLQRDEAVHIKQHYHIVVLDESQYIKNAATKTTKVAYRLQANHRICLSGTPMENHLGELWSTFNFLMPGLLQSNKEFTAVYRSPIERSGDTAKQISLNRRVGPLMLRRTKDVVATELPPKTIIPHHISLSQEQADVYESVRATMDKRVRDAVKAQGLDKSQIIILDALLKLRQICCHPQLLTLKEAQKVESSAKLDYLTKLLATLIEEGRRILIFSQFTTMLSLIEKHLSSEKIPFVKITGATRDRETPVEKFQSGSIPVFLISLKAGGTGLNLTAADTVIHYDPWWNPAAENQATDRAYRIGQDKPVFVHKLICQGTVEEHIQELQKKKSQLVESLLSGSTNKLSITPETLNGLLAPAENL